MRHKTAYLEAVMRELELRKNYLNGESLETVYFGGGTPSQLQADDFERIFETVHRYYSVVAGAEITLEANPDDLTPAYLSALQPLPFNRISLGIQSFRDADLRMLHRRHGSRQAVNAVHRCREHGYGNLSIDLIYGIPGQTLERWKENLEVALQLNVPHLSAYHLSYEEGTTLYRQWQSGAVCPVDEEISVQLYHTLLYMLARAGYLQYEISNFCKPDCFSRHNSSYWTGRKYLGVGPAAHSCDLDSRQWNIASLEEYLRGIICGNPAVEKECLDLRTQYNDYVITRLRTVWGIRTVDLRETFGTELADHFLRHAQPYIRNGLLVVSDGTFRLTPLSAFISDGILSDLMKE
jgi:oxygen-independent coproporphyrinogen-3 oxidase